MPRALLSLLLACAAGCATPLPTLPDPIGAPGPILAVAPVAVTCTPTEARPTTLSVGPYERKLCVSCDEEQPVDDGTRSECVECGYGPFRRVFERPYVPTLQVAGIDEQLVSTLRERKTFAEVVALEAQGPPSRARTAALLDEARAAGAEWVLELEVDGLEVSFLEHNNWYVPKIATFIICAILIFPAVDPPNWFIPGEDYGVTVRGRYHLREVKTGVLLDQGRFDREVCRDSFAAFGLGSIPSRGFFIAGFLRVPGCLDEDDWAEISQNLKPAADLGLLQALVLETENVRNSSQD